MVKSLISVILPVYNAEKYIERCLESIIHQTYAPIEILLINDGSTDTSPAIMKKYASEHNCIRYFDNANSGVSASRNYGIEEAKGDYIFFVDSDDWIEADTLERLYQQFETNVDIQFAVSGVCFDLKNTTKVIQTNDCVLTREKALLSLFNDGYIRPVVWGKLIESSLLKENIIRFDRDIFYSEDVKFVFDMLIKSQKIAIISKPLYHYIQYNEDSAMNTVREHKQFNTKWLTKWKAYERMEIAIVNSYSNNDNVSMEFIAARVEAARDMLHLLYQYKIEDHEFKKRLKQYLRKNMYIYLKTRRVPIIKKLAMSVNLVSTLLAYQLKEILT
jgi:glycosyltransferase involved in cell wall biosynthesis